MNTDRTRNLPNLLIIGAQKAATTWLRDALMNHPDVFMAEGEPQYFNRDASNIEEYLDRFGDGRHCRVVGEKTPDYLHMSTARIKRTQRMLGTIKVIAILRRPEDRAWSQARMEESSFNQSQLGPTAIDRLACNVISLRNRDRCAYAKHLKRWINVFGSRALMVCFYEDVVERPDELMTRVFRWLDLDPDTAASLPPPVWQSPLAQMPDAISQYLSSVHGGEFDRLRAMGLDPPRSWGNCLATPTDHLPLLRHRVEMLLPNTVYRIFDIARGRLPGRYTTLANRCFHRYLTAPLRNRRLKHF